MRSSGFRCVFTALLGAWVVMIFLPSFLLAASGVGGQGGGLAAGWRVADEVGPFAKLTMMGIAAVLLLGAARVTGRSAALRHVSAAALGVMAVVLTLGLLPESLSRGFGIGLTGARFDGATLPIYLLGGAGGGLAFSLILTRCRRERG